MTRSSYVHTTWPTPAPDPAAEALAEIAALMAGAPRGDWLSRARCRDAADDVHYPTGKPGAPAYEAAVARAKTECAWCPVLAECRAWALDTREPHGIWGATTPDERRAITDTDDRAARRAS